MKLKKTLFTLANRLKKMTEKEVQIEIEKLIYSYELKIRYGAQDKLIAFTNSIYTPTFKLTTDKEFDLQERSKLLKSKKRRTAKANINVIIMMLQEGSSYPEIAQKLSRFHVPNDKRSSRKKRLKPYFNTMFISRFCKDYKLYKYNKHISSDNK